uniref:Sex comb on midleg-like protein 1 n=1 Tax=Sus scrofa TaxID=9823 RepID=A0A8D0I077_PIG
MSSGSSEVDVIRTRIPAYDDDNTVLYAYEPNTAYINNQESVVSDTAYNEEQQKTVLDVLTHCQAIQDAIQNLDKKFDVIHGKVSKIHRLRMKSLWQNRKLLGYAYKTYLLSRKSKVHRVRRRESPAVFSYPESYSPTTPVARRENDSESYPMGTPCPSEGSPEREQESFFHDQEPGYSQSPPLPSFYPTDSYQSYYTPDDPMQDSSSMPCYGSPGARSSCSFFSAAQANAAVPGTMLAQGEPSPAHNPEMMGYPALGEDNLSQNAASLCVPGSYAPSSPVGNDTDVLKQTYSSEPSTWSVDEVIVFLQSIDPQLSDSLADLFRQHDIDGKALLLLKSDMMIKYMGLKLGTAVKLCHYIERLKGKYFNN